MGGRGEGQRTTNNNETKEKEISVADEFSIFHETPYCRLVFIMWRIRKKVNKCVLAWEYRIFEKATNLGLAIPNTPLVYLWRRSETPRKTGRAGHTRRFKYENSAVAVGHPPGPRRGRRQREGEGTHHLSLSRHRAPYAPAPGVLARTPTPTDRPLQPTSPPPTTTTDEPPRSLLCVRGGLWKSARGDGRNVYYFVTTSLPRASRRC